MRNERQQRSDPGIAVALSIIGGIMLAIAILTVFGMFIGMARSGSVTASDDTVATGAVMSIPLSLLMMGAGRAIAILNRIDWNLEKEIDRRWQELRKAEK